MTQRILALSCAGVLHQLMLFTRTNSIIEIFAVECLLIFIYYIFLAAKRLDRKKPTIDNEIDNEVKMT